MRRGYSEGEEDRSRKRERRESNFGGNERDAKESKT